MAPQQQAGELGQFKVAGEKGQNVTNREFETIAIAHDCENNVPASNSNVKIGGGKVKTRQVEFCKKMCRVRNYSAGAIFLCFHSAFLFPARRFSKFGGRSIIYTHDISIKIAVEARSEKCVEI